MSKTHRYANFEKFSDFTVNGCTLEKAISGMPMLKYLFKIIKKCASRFQVCPFIKVGFALKIYKKKFKMILLGRCNYVQQLCGNN